MLIATSIVAAAFIFVNGRNDGAALLAIPLQTARRLPVLPMLLLWLMLPAIPLLGMWWVAESLEKMMGFNANAAGQSLAIMAAVLVTIGMSTVVGIPTSITLALVGALVGASLAEGSPITLALVGRVLLLGLAAPLVAGALSYLLSWISLRAPGKSSPHRVLSRLQDLMVGALTFAYAANDGQKVLFALALVQGIGVREAATQPWMMLAASTIFMLGALVGLRASARFVRHGITMVTPVGLLWTEAATALTVIGGSVAGVPLSMTQSLTGSLLGIGVARSHRAVYWRGIARVGIAWVWTLPVAGILAFVGVVALDYFGV